MRCPLTCHCTGNYTQAIVSCQNSFLTYTPHLPDVTWKLFINGNNITHVRADAFSNVHNLYLLRILKNNIRSMDERTFEGLTTLQSLYLFESGLTSIESGLFRFVPNLLRLNLRLKVEVPQRGICTLKHLQKLHLGLFKFPSAAMFHPCFQELTKLRTLTLNHMVLEHRNLSRATFHPFRNSLTVLHVVQCWLRHLPVDIFKDLVNLIELDLNDNIITSLPNDIFISLTHLTHLNIKGNRLMVISGELLRPFHYMRQLTIGGNTHLNLTLGDEFLNMTRLTHLILSNIKLPSLNSGTFRQLRHCPLVEVDMSGCHIQSITKAAFRPLRNLTVLSLDDNTLNASVLHDTFYGLQGAPVRELRLSNVHLQNLSPTMFIALNQSNMTTVRLRNSGRASIERRLLQSASNI